MSYTFSRRAFLKYSATTAVAMAGAGLLGGCEFKDPNNPVSKELPSTITSKLQVIASLNTMKIADNTCTLEVEIQSARVNPIRLTADCFSVAVKDAAGKQRYLSLTNGGVQIKSAENLQLQKKKSTKVQLAAIGFPKELEEGDTVIFKFIPVRENSEMSLTWEISKEEYENAITEEGGGSSEAPEPGASTTA
jgi:hypothetical protein